MYHENETVRFRQIFVILLENLTFKKKVLFHQKNLMTWNSSRVSTLCLLCYVLLSFGNSWEAHSFRENSNKLTNFCWFLLRSQLARKMAIFTKITRQMTKWKMTEQLSQKNKEARHYRLKVQSTEIRTFFES